MNTPVHSDELCYYCKRDTPRLISYRCSTCHFFEYLPGTNPVGDPLPRVGNKNAGESIPGVIDRIAVVKGQLLVV